MNNNEFNTFQINQEIELFIKDSQLSFVFSLFSLSFSASLIGLILNFIINSQEPVTHLFYIAGILFSIIGGVVVNSYDKMKARRLMRKQMQRMFQIQD